jgi:hypothetical protein
MLIPNSYTYRISGAIDNHVSEIRKRNASDTISLAKTVFTNLSGVTVIPEIINSLMKIYNLTESAINLYNLKKHLELLIRVNQTSEKQRLEFCEKLKSDNKFCEEYCAAVSIIVEKVTSIDKIKLIANLINSLVSKQINDGEFLRMMHIVDSLSWHDLYCGYLFTVNELDLEETDSSLKPKFGNSTLFQLQIHGIINILNDQNMPIISYTDFGSKYFNNTFTSFKYGTPKVSSIRSIIKGKKNK